jgi:hypothetical protein
VTHSKSNTYNVLPKAPIEEAPHGGEEHELNSQKRKQISKAHKEQRRFGDESLFLQQLSLQSILSSGFETYLNRDSKLEAAKASVSIKRARLIVSSPYLISFSGAKGRK